MERYWMVIKSNHPLVFEDIELPDMPVSESTEGVPLNTAGSVGREEELECAALIDQEIRNGFPSGVDSDLAHELGRFIADGFTFIGRSARLYDVSGGGQLGDFKRSFDGNDDVPGTFKRPAPDNRADAARAGNFFIGYIGNVGEFPLEDLTAFNNAYEVFLKGNFDLKNEEGDLNDIRNGFRASELGCKF